MEYKIPRQNIIDLRNKLEDYCILKKYNWIEEQECSWFGLEMPEKYVTRLSDTIEVERICALYGKHMCAYT